MISEKMRDGLLAQVNLEFSSAYVYMAMSSYASHAGLKGVANWFFLQTQEEMMHAQKLANYVDEQGEHVVLKGIPEPQAKYDGVTQLFEAALEHEQTVTKSVNKLSTLAIEEDDHATNALLQWFVSEQVEEEANVRDILDMLKLAGETGHGMFLVDKELGQRTLSAPEA